MKLYYIKKLFSLLIMLPSIGFAQLSFEGLVKDENTQTVLEGALVVVKPLRISGAGYYSGKTTDVDGAFKLSTNYTYPLRLEVSKAGCKKQVIKIKNDEDVTSYIIVMDCEKEIIDQIIIERATDSDNDGIVDIKDKCPDEAGSEENEGCPWPDSDNDGVIDKDDACPDIAGIKEKDGCPITDRDEDGINDENDSCPDEPGNSKNNGCPDKPAAIVDIINSSQILFNFSGDQPINQSDSFLNNLSELLKKYPYINLKIKGHASNEGPEQYNQVLSERRSANIKTVLESFGVESTRLKVVGEGENNPPFSNDSKENRTKNRTVLISIE